MGEPLYAVYEEMNKITVYPKVGSHAHPHDNESINYPI